MLEALEGAAGVLGVGLRYDLELLEIRLGDLRRRIPEYGRLVRLAQETAAACRRDRARAHELVAQVLAAWQADRSSETSLVGWSGERSETETLP